MIGKTELREVSMLLLLELACVPVGAMVVVGERVIGLVRSPPEMTGTTMVVPLEVCVTLMTAGGLVTAPGMAEVVVAFALFDTLTLGIPPLLVEKLETDLVDVSSALDELDELELLDVLPVPGKGSVELMLERDGELIDADDKDVLEGLLEPGGTIVVLPAAKELELDSGEEVDKLVAVSVPGRFVVVLPATGKLRLDDEGVVRVVDEDVLVDKIEVSTMDVLL
jgi:hypothetical protein